MSDNHITIADVLAHQAEHTAARMRIHDPDPKTTEEQRIYRELGRERKRHEQVIARLLTRASAIGMYVPGANPYLYPGTFRGPFRADSPK